MQLAAAGTDLPVLPASTPAVPAPQTIPPDPRWRLCPRRAPAPRFDPTITGTRLSADRVDIRQGTRFLLQGHARVETASQRLTADRILYDKAADEVRIQGRLHYADPGLEITGTGARFSQGGQRGEIHQVEYRLFSAHARGHAAAVYKDSPTLKRLERASYTTCPAGAEHWRLDARKVRLDQASGVGRARDVALRLGGVPVAYTPWISFPLDDRRKTGFLMPSFGHSQSSGTDISIPWYWNIAPWQDATLTPRLLSRRGTQLRAEYRYLLASGSGQVQGEFLPADRADNGRDRLLLRLRHSGNPRPRLHTELLYQKVSDARYFQDLGDHLGLSAITHLERNGLAHYDGDGWWAETQLQDYQTVDPTLPPSSRPYKRLPRFAVAWLPHAAPGGLRYQGRGEWVRFDQEGRVTGRRLDLDATLERPWSGSAWFLTPRAGLRFTRYRLRNVTPGAPVHPRRSLGWLSLDSGLFLERDLVLAGRPWLQTLEPRAYYLFVPRRNQADIPVFDSGRKDFGYGELFTDNRFSGADRVGDANQLTLALSSRLLDADSGRQPLKVSVGQILYFRDRTVTLPGGVAEGQATSNLVGLVESRLGPWRLSAGAQWRPSHLRTDRSNVALHYRRDDHHLANLTYRFRDNDLEQVDASSVWYFTPAWHGVGRWNYSLAHHSLLEGLVGIEYENCCWMLRLLERSYVNDIGGARNDAVLVQLELKGLTSVGDPIGSIMENGILGYHERH